MKKNAVRLFFLLVSVGFYYWTANAQTISVKGSVEPKSVKKGKTGKGWILLSVPRELHINSSTPTSEFMIPTKVSLSSREIGKFKVIYPKGENRKFDFSAEPINVYEGETIIRFSFRVPLKPKGNRLKIRALVSYQACTNEVCYQPQKKEMVLRVKVF